MNQSEHHMINSDSHLPKKVVEASYLKQVIREYSGNPLVEALPEVLSAKGAADRLMLRPMCDPDELLLLPKHRVHCVQRLKREWFFPFPKVLMFEQKFSAMIRQGYVHRNPFSDKGQWCIYSIAQAADWMDIPGQNISSSSCIFVTGVSGIGKTSMVRRVLSLYPQLVIHSNYHGTPFNWSQILWLRLDCPPDGSRTGFCYDFFNEVDRVLGTSYLKQYGRAAKLDVLVNNMVKVASVSFLGVLVVDEVQNLCRAKGGGAKEFLAFLRNLNNKLGIPIVAVGTYAARDLFCHWMQDGRRITDGGLIDLQRPEKDSKPWFGFLEALERYQWLPNAEPFSPGFRDKLYDLTMGITDFAVRLVIFAQEIAINEGKGALSEELLVRASRQNFQLLQPALSALRSNSTKRMAQYDDLLPIANRDALDKHSVACGTPYFTEPPASSDASAHPETRSDIRDDANLLSEDLEVAALSCNGEAGLDREDDPKIGHAKDVFEIRKASMAEDPHAVLKDAGLIESVWPQSPTPVTVALSKIPRKF